jgi:AraC-like DNA-binding protein
MINANREVTLSGGGPVCLTLDGLCGRREACGQAHQTLHAAAFESGHIQQVRCPLGFLLVSVPVRVKTSWLGQIEFGPLGVERIDRFEFERYLSRLGFPMAQRLQLLASLNELRTVRADDVEGVLALVERVAGLVAEEMLRRSAGLGMGEPAAVTAGRRYAERHLGDKITLADVARHVALSSDHFSRLFRNSTGISFGEYVNRRRVESAQHLLADSNQRVADISYACGFDSVPHFNRVFRRVTGISPTSHRRQIRSFQSGDP